MRRRGAPAREAPFALWSRINGAERLAAVNAAAEAQRLKPGMAVADARALCPSLRLEDHDPEADATTLAAIADWCSRFTPLAALDAPNGVMLDVTGAAELFGGEAKLLDEIEACLGAQGFHARAALAGGPAFARALARFSKLRLVPPSLTQEEIETLAAPLPVAALGLDEPAATRLARAGLVRVGDLLARPRAPLAARLGAAAIARLDALVCRTREPIVPRFPAPSHIAERRFPDGLTRLADIEATLRLLCEDLRPLLERSGLGARRLEAAFYRVDGAVKRLVVGTSRPLRDPLRLFGLLHERLGRLAEEGLDTGYGFDVLRLAAIATERLDDEQRGLDTIASDHAVFRRNRLNTENVIDSKSLERDLCEKPVPTFSHRALDHIADEFADVVDRLGARLGPSRVLRLDLMERHLPECAVRAAPAASAPAAVASMKFAPLARPLRLFEQPEPIDAIALAPDGPPLRFRWRRALHDIAAFEGPERIAPPWWQAPRNELARDYFHVVDREGQRFWLFREGLPGQDAIHARWFVHGLF
ncbi:hypothetical protein B1812_05725 [Methylocystis bryophila]|uniref:DNA-directed DNA polymerase n=1 Tax=Methylocystis bryophila TaxID=655015 RepID=A0A1W6N0Q0_9HYPH|nr:hypothetical protein B1812_05725 [Methylocystis bryophila]